MRNTKANWRAGLIAAAASTTMAVSAAVAAPAQAASPGELQIRGGIECHFGQKGSTWNNLWYQVRWMTVVNIGGTTMRNVTLQEINGPRVTVREIKPGQSMSHWNNKTKRWQRPIETRWTGCVPTSISGYTWGDTYDDLGNNFGFWRTDIQRPANPNVPPPAGSS
ncbi:hypothetical protein HUN08_16150 [Gordonia sp. X0973]|uniref:hypothetical protein n=1 Tax=Gordonia sp. X0973 TaxID=2742602 RepID=UPI000F52D66B|nr:hypothetical protein [Gordonia sp. X0973]QKT08560.1 hypothetical protein HUN08_16150 [Gordonia sp. X0973]